MSNSLRIVVTGLIAHHPLGGVCWDYVQFPIGLARLGHDVFYFEDSGEWPYGLPSGAGDSDCLVADCNASVKYLAAVMDSFGLGNRWAYRCTIDGSWAGLSSARRNEVLESADLLLNVSGTLASPEEYGRIPVRAYIDSDPVFTQIKLLSQERFRDLVDCHTVCFTFGETLSASPVETSRVWHPTRQPIVLDEWRASREPHRGVFTTVMNWSSYAPAVHAGRRYGQKDVEFLKFLALPGRVAPVQVEVSGRGFQADSPTLAVTSGATCYDLLVGNGFRVVDSSGTCADFKSYRRYVEDSQAEWSVAKNGYVEGRTGWFSCRSACYLAAGRPVVVQDTGFGSVIPTGEGVLAFTDLDGAVDAIQQVDANYPRHAGAARDIASTYFDSAKVLEGLLDVAFSATSSAAQI